MEDNVTEVTEESTLGTVIAQRKKFSEEGERGICEKRRKKV